jgi:hypothetical protein
LLLLLLLQVMEGGLKAVDKGYEFALLLRFKVPWLVFLQSTRGNVMMQYILMAAGMSRGCPDSSSTVVATFAAAAAIGHSKRRLESIEYAVDLSEEFLRFIFNRR